MSQLKYYIVDGLETYQGNHGFTTGLRRSGAPGPRCSSAARTRREETAPPARRGSAPPSRDSSPGTHPMQGESIDVTTPTSWSESHYIQFPLFAFAVWRRQHLPQPRPRLPSRSKSASADCGRSNSCSRDCNRSSSRSGRCLLRCRRWGRRRQCPPPSLRR